MKLPLITAGAAFLGLVAAVPGAYYFGKHRAGAAGQAHIVSRSKAIRSHAAQAKGVSIVVIGDSMVELADLRDLCGPTVQTLNAGVSGARTQDVEALAIELIGSVKPAAVVIGLGTNDAWANNTTSSATFTRAYASIVSAARRAGAAPYALIPPPQGDRTFEKAATFSASALERRRTEIRSMGIPVIDTATLLAARDGSFDRRYTADGVHPNAAGYVIWKQAIRSALSQQICVAHTATPPVA